MTDTPPAVSGVLDLIDLPFAADLIGFPHVTIWRLVRRKVIPSIRVGRTFRVPRDLFDQARDIVMRGGAVVLEDLATQWKEDNGWNEPETAAKAS